MTEEQTQTVEILRNLFNNMMDMGSYSALNESDLKIVNFLSKMINCANLRINWIAVIEEYPSFLNCLMWLQNHLPTETTHQNIVDTLKDIKVLCCYFEEAPSDMRNWFIYFFVAAYHQWICDNGGWSAFLSKLPILEPES